jgi:FkbM family methyltransferase
MLQVSKVVGNQMSGKQVNGSLIIDVGVSDGQDTAFYLAKGFKVVGVEADPSAYSRLLDQFAPELARRDLILINRAADAASGNTVKFKPNIAHQGGSRIVHEPEHQTGVGVEAGMVDVETVSWPELTSIAGVPYYCKIDIEGSERYFLQGFLGRPELLPTYVSAEIHTFAPVELLYAAGYRQFKVVNQRNIHIVRTPDPPLEGKYVPNHIFRHASGPFGRETPGRTWVDFQEVAGLFNLMQEARRRLTMRDWFDVHAWLPD